jgi:hypothetical protein
MNRNGHRSDTAAQRADLPDRVLQTRMEQSMQMPRRERTDLQNRQRAQAGVYRAQPPSLSSQTHTAGPLPTTAGNSLPVGSRPPTQEPLQARTSSEFARGVEFLCIACFEVVYGLPAARIANYSYCQACFDLGIRPQFRAHLRNEHQPVRLNGQDITIDEVANQFSPDFVAAYRARMELYDILPAERLMCASGDCGYFLGRKSLELGISVCPMCRGRTCTRCSEDSNGNAGFLGPHVCAGLDLQPQDPLEGLVRGRDYQLCPSCGTAVYRYDGCNRMTCVVRACRRTEFCYLCGERASTYPGHFGTLCPMYGGAPNVFRRQSLGDQAVHGPDFHQFVGQAPAFRNQSQERWMEFRHRHNMEWPWSMGW